MWVCHLVQNWITSRILEELNLVKKKKRCTRQFWADSTLYKKKLVTGPRLHLLPPLFFTFGLDSVPVGTALHQVCNYRKLTWNPDIYKKLINLKWKLTLNSSPGRNQICASVSKPSPNFRLKGWRKILFKLDLFTQINDCQLKRPVLSFIFTWYSQLLVCLVLLK